MKQRRHALSRMTLDASRVSSIASRPGIDPRVWLSLAVVLDVGFDAKEGTFVDVRLLDTGEEETCYLGSPYAGGGFGDHCPLEIDDTVLVAIPGGDPNTGPIIIGRFNNAGDPPHVDFNSQNRVIRAKPGNDVRIVASAGARVQIIAEAGATIQLGDDTVLPGAQGVLTGESIDPFTGKPHSVLGNASLTVAAKKGPP